MVDFILPLFDDVTIWLFNISNWKITIFNRSTIYFYGPWLPWQTVTNNQRVTPHEIPLVPLTTQGEQLDHSQHCNQCLRQRSLVEPCRCSFLFEKHGHVKWQFNTEREFIATTVIGCHHSKLENHHSE